MRHPEAGPRRVLPARAPRDLSGPWTVQAVQVLVTMGAEHRTVVDREGNYPAWEWEYRSPGFRLHLLGYLELHDDQWVYVLELTRDRAPGEEYRRLMVKTVTLHGDEALMCEEAAAMLNYALASVATTGIEARA